MARAVALPSRGGACPVQLTSEWLWFRSWLARYRNYTGRMPASADEGPLLVGLARVRRHCVVEEGPQRKESGPS